MLKCLFNNNNMVAVLRGHSSFPQFSDNWVLKIFDTLKMFEVHGHCVLACVGFAELRSQKPYL